MPRFNARQIEHLIHGGQQQFTAAPRGFRIGVLFGIKCCIKQQGNRAHHAIHGRADFMAHEGQEIAFLRIGAFRRAAGAFRIAGELLTCGDIMLNAENIAHFAIIAENRRQMQFIDKTRSILAVIDDFNVNRLAVFNRLTQRLDMARIGPRALQEAAIAPDHFFFTIARDAIKCRVGVDDGAIRQVRVANNDPRRRCKHGSAQHALQGRRQIRRGLTRCRRRALRMGHRASSSRQEMKVQSGLRRPAPRRPPGAAGQSPRPWCRRSPADHPGSPRAGRG